MSCAKHILCGRCGREVFHAERKIALNKVWHSFCFSCAKCNKLLDSCGVNPLDGELYCDLCYYEITSGIVDERSGDETTKYRDRSKSINKTYNISRRDDESFNKTYTVSRRGDEPLNKTYTISRRDEEPLNKTYTISRRDEEPLNKTYNIPRRDDEYNSHIASYNESFRDSPKGASTPYRKGSPEQLSRETSRNQSSKNSSNNSSRMQSPTNKSNISEYRTTLGPSAFISQAQESERELTTENLSSPTNENTATTYKTVLSITPAQFQSDQRDFVSKEATPYKSIATENTRNETSRFDSTGISSSASSRYKAGARFDSTVMSSPVYSRKQSDTMNDTSGFDSTGISSPASSRHKSGARFDSTVMSSPVYYRNESNRMNDTSGFDSTGISSPTSSRHKSGARFDSTAMSSPVYSRNESNRMTDTSGFDSTGISSAMSSRNRSSRYETTFDNTGQSRRTNSPNRTGNSTYISARNNNNINSSYKSARNNITSPDVTNNSSYRTGRADESSKFPPSDRTFKGSYKLSTPDPSSRRETTYKSSAYDKSSKAQTTKEESRRTSYDKSGTIRSRDVSSKRTGDYTGDSRGTRSPMYDRRDGDDGFCNYPKCPQKCQGCSCQHELPEQESNVDLIDNPEDIVLCTPGDCNLPTPREVTTYYSRRVSDRICKTCFPKYDENEIEREICRRCRRKVYIMEKRVAAGGVFHDCCFNCFMCRKPLSSLSLLCRHGEIYCNRCYLRYFGPKVYGHGFLPSLDP